MTRREAAIVGAYTGILMGDTSDVNKYIVYILGRELNVYELLRPEILREVKEKIEQDFLELCYNLTED